ncbi:MAG TPA: choice-of-anchor Q domain-containing protein [Candidatus Dormibacteraeota bacterium]|nr:choice-of-anchor Q domain-containing protein [Candidatus Dormibacteraeota bacterium]
MQHPRRLAVCALGGLAVAAAPTLVAPRTASAATTTFTVTTATDPTTGTACPAAGGSPCSLRAAVAAADALGSGSTVVIDFAVKGPFDVGTNGSLNVSGGEDLTIQGASDGSTVVDGGGLVRPFSESAISCPRGSTTLTLSMLTVTNGHAAASTAGPDDGFGGGIDVDCGNALHVVDSTFSKNTADNGGGAIDDNTTSTVTVLRSAVTGNTASGAILASPPDGGGGIELSTAGTLTVIDSTLSGNQSAWDGGGIFAVTGATMTLVNDTVAGNTAPSGKAGGISAAANLTSSIGNTIVSGNTPANCSGTLTDGGNNLEQGTSCGFATRAVDADPKLGALQSNGGPTETMALNPGSPAIDAASDTVCAAAVTASPPGAGGLDQRSATRPQGAHCDIGAFEVVATTTTLSAPTTAKAGDPLTLTATVSPAQPIPGEPTGTVTFLDGSTVLGTGQLSGSSPDTAGFSLTAPSTGTHVLTARFEQTPLFLSSTSAGVTLSILITPPNAGASGVPAGGSPLPLGAGILGGAAAVLVARRVMAKRR